MDMIARNRFPIALVLLAAASRLLPHPPNVTPVAALALLGGAALDKRLAYGVPLAALFLSDLFLGFHATLPFVYAGFFLTAALGAQLRDRRTAGSIAAASLAASVLFFVLTNFGVWLIGGLYPMDAAGLRTCYAAALPFFRNSIAGDLSYTLLLFGLDALLRRRFAAVPVAA